MSRHMYSIVIAVLLVLASAAAWAAPPDLTIAEHPLPAGARVRFHVSGAQLSAPRSEADPEPTNEGRFEFVVDPPSLDWTDVGESRYGYFHVFIRQRGKTQFSRFKLSATPYGQFQDGWADVKFSVSQDGVTDKGELHLLLVSLDPPDGLKLRGGDAVHDILLTGRTEVNLTFDSVVGAPIETATPHMISNDPLWRAAPSRLSSATSKIGHRQSMRVSFAFEPDLVDAIQRSLQPPSEGAAHVSVPVVFTYHLMDFPDRTRELHTEIKLRFRPSPWSLPLALVLGLALGTLIRVMASLVGWKTTIRTAVVACGTTFLFWLIALILVALRSEFKLFGLPLDPFQIVPTFVFGAIGALMGVATLTALKRLLKT